MGAHCPCWAIAEKEVVCESKGVALLFKQVPPQINPLVVDDGKGTCIYMLHVHASQLRKQRHAIYSIGHPGNPPGKPDANKPTSWLPCQWYPVTNTHMQPTRGLPLAKNERLQSIRLHGNMGEGNAYSPGSGPMTPAEKDTFLGKNIGKP